MQIRIVTLTHCSCIWALQWVKKKLEKKLVVNKQDWHMKMNEFHALEKQETYWAPHGLTMKTPSSFWFQTVAGFGFGCWFCLFKAKGILPQSTCPYFACFLHILTHRLSKQFVTSLFPFHMFNFPPLFIRTSNFNLSDFLISSFFSS